MTKTKKITKNEKISNYFFGSILCIGFIAILKLLFGEYYIDAMAVLLIFANVCFMIKNGIKKSDFKKEYIQKMEIKRGGIALIHSFLVFVFWLLYNATMG